MSDKYNEASFHSSEYNPLTGLLYNQSFFQEAARFLKDIQPDTYCMVAVDIEHFRLFNKLYGRKAGNELIVYISDCLRRIMQFNIGLSGYLGGDNFVLLLPDNPELINILKDDISAGIKQWNNTVGFLPAFGIYAIDNPALAAEDIYDGAATALSLALNEHSRRICRYDKSLETAMEEELLLLTEIQEALEKEEFTFYAQPQCDISTGKIVGAESLVRWIHPAKGIIPPGVFIPVLEKNGLISELDRYVWKKVFEWIRSWIDRGFHPVPISINVSRVDIFSMDVSGYLFDLLQKYDLPAKYVKVEITEGTYAESNVTIDKTVKELRSNGFTVMMDDFGCGYSSLNMLKNIPVDVLKMDMRFLDIKEQEKERGIGILESVINMARLMQLPIIVEGVETQTQEKFLLSLGCRYTQGFYYYRPLPIEQFEELLSDTRRLDFSGLWCKQVEPLHMREFLDKNLFNDNMINNILGAVAFYEMYENQIEVTRVNEQYFRLAGASDSIENSSVKRFWNHVRDDDRPALYAIFEQAYENPVQGADGYIHFLRSDGKVLWVYMRVFFLRETEGRKLFYSSLTDATALRNKKTDAAIKPSGLIEFSAEQLNQLKKYYDNFPFGYLIAKIISDSSDSHIDFEIAYVNRIIKKICGKDINRLKLLTLKDFNENPDDINKKIYRTAYFGETANFEMYSSISNRYLKLTFYQYEYGYIACILQDMTHSHVSENALNSILHSYREVHFIHLRDNYCRMIYPDENQLLERGNYEETINRKFHTGKISSTDEHNVRKFLSIENLRTVLKHQEATEYAYQRNTNGIHDEWCLTSLTVSEREADGTPTTAIMVIRSIDTLMRESADKRKQRLAESLANMSDGFFIYQAEGNEKILYTNPKVLEIFGCETIFEFRELVNSSFRGMVHPEDLPRIEWEIKDQIRHSEHNTDFIQYRIIRKDGEIRWLDDCGHLELASTGAGGALFYVFISDITDSITEAEKNKLINMNKYYQPDESQHTASANTP